MKLSPYVQQLKPSATLAINEKSAELIAAGKAVYRLGFGQSPFPVPPEVIAALQKHAHQKAYLPVKGLYELRKAVAGFNRRTLGLECKPEQVMIGPGSKELIYDLLLATDSDLLLPSPSWVSYEPQASLVGKKTHWIDTRPEDNWLLQAAALEVACEKEPHRPKVLILNYPNNPTGTTYAASQLQALAAVARKYSLLVIADEIYAEVHHQGQHLSLASFYPEGTIISGGLSKWCGAGGWRLGTFTFPAGYSWLIDAMATIASETFTSVSAPIQWAAITAFEGSPAISHYLDNSRKILAAVGRYVYDQLRQVQIQMPPAAGGFYLFPNFDYYQTTLAQKGIHSSSDLCAKLLDEAGVALLPGAAFGRLENDLSCRLSFVDFDGAELLQILEDDPQLPVDEDFVLLHCPQMVAGVQAIKDWLV
jgi:aspartate aminotransferase